MFSVKVKPDNGPEYTVKVAMRDVLTWEKTTRGNKSINDFFRDINVVDTYRMAHIASWRQGLFDGTLKDFEEATDVTFEGEEEDEDPTLPARSVEPSSPSPSEPESPRPSGRKKATAQ